MRRLYTALLFDKGVVGGYYRIYTKNKRYMIKIVYAMYYKQTKCKKEDINIVVARAFVYKNYFKKGEIKDDIYLL